LFPKTRIISTVELDPFYFERLERQCFCDAVSSGEEPAEGADDPEEFRQTDKLKSAGTQVAESAGERAVEHFFGRQPMER
jgi:hypothetical protein